MLPRSRSRGHSSRAGCSTSSMSQACRPLPECSSGVSALAVVLQNRWSQSRTNASCATIGSRTCVSTTHAGPASLCSKQYPQYSLVPHQRNMCHSTRLRMLRHSHGMHVRRNLVAHHAPLAAAWCACDRRCEHHQPQHDASLSSHCGTVCIMHVGNTAQAKRVAKRCGPVCGPRCNPGKPCNFSARAYHTECLSRGVLYNNSDA